MEDSMVKNNGNKFWFMNGLLHRTDGRAVQYSNGMKKWYMDRVLYLEYTDWEPTEDDLDHITELFTNA